MSLPLVYNTLSLGSSASDIVTAISNVGKPLATVHKTIAIEFSFLKKGMNRSSRTWSGRRLTAAAAAAVEY